ncbi:nucleoside phosphorylase [Comamonas testosteroni]|uniref:phosphorylase family protein n=1 Tax=Comamonas testosteroni TaxID=285 RepID=UPI0015FDA179|nr:nucleoside phosphorylase [Comamonas testosteroni]
MKILLIEDNEKKRRVISKYLESKGISAKDILYAKTMTDFSAHLGSEIGLFIIDFYLPYVDGGEAQPNGKAILQSIIKAGKVDALLLAISSHPDEFPELRSMYEANGCILANYEDKRSWQSTLDHLLVQLRKNTRFDFVVFCALQEERNPYATLLNCQPVIRAGIDCLDFTLDGRRGTAVLLPQMGLVNAAITAAICIERFRPTLIGMSGICGGFEKRTNLGQLLISSMSYEYQSGKWSSDGFLHEPYQVSTDHLTLVRLRALAASNQLVSSLEAGFTGEKPKVETSPEVCIFTSGSAVIASDTYLQQVALIHRKVTALDMEVYAIQRAAELSTCTPACICAKTVVDLCGTEKNDDLHAYGSFISANFMISAFKKHFEATK